MRGVNNLFPKVCEFILFLTLNLLGKYFVKWPKTHFNFAIKICMFKFWNQHQSFTKNTASSQAIAHEHVSELIYLT